MINPFGTVQEKDILQAKEQFGTPLYLYDESLIAAKCAEVLGMPSAYGLSARYAMKANSNATLLRRIHRQGLMIDASSLNEVRRAYLASIGPEQIMLTTQEVPEGEDRAQLERFILNGMRYNVCSLRQLQLIGPFAQKHGIDLSIRIHPGVGAGESASRNTGDKYSCFGIHLSNVKQAIDYAEEMGIRFTQVHVHIGSGGDPEIWKQNIDLELDILARFFPDAETVSFGGGLREARMPEDTAADLTALGAYAKRQIEEFYQRTGRKLKMEIEPGTYIVANSGYAVTQVVDKKRTGPDGLNFIIVNGGIEINARPLLYGSRHPFYILSGDGRLRFSDFNGSSGYEAIVTGRCCESGDSQCLDEHGNNVPRRLVEPEIGDLVVIGGTGAYCSVLTPFNYNSHTQIPEVLLEQNGQLTLIRKRQTLEQILENEL